MIAAGTTRRSGLGGSMLTGVLRKPVWKYRECRHLSAHQRGSCSGAGVATCGYAVLKAARYCINGTLVSLWHWWFVHRGFSRGNEVL